MISNSISSQFSLNQFSPQSAGIVAPTRGEFSSGNTLSTLKPVTAAAESARLQIRASVSTPVEGEIREEVNRLEVSEQEAREQAQSRTEETLQRRQEQAELETINRLAARDKEVRAHEQAHAAVGGQYAGAPSYTYERGPNGVRYAVAGEVPIDVGAEATPEETIRKAQIVRRAALAPAEPSPQDRRVAAQASQLEAGARQELAVQVRQEAEAQQEADRTESTNEPSSQVSQTPESDTSASTVGVATGGAANASPVNLISSSAQSLSSSSFNLANRLNESIATSNFVFSRQGTLFDGLV